MSSSNTDSASIQQKLLQNPKIAKLKNAITQRVLHLMQEGIPTKIADLTEQFQLAPLSTSSHLSSLQAAALATASDPGKVLEQIVNSLRDKAFELLDDATLLVTWIKLNMPKIADGNNFGVEIQLEIVKELQTAAQLAACILRNVTNYFEKRAQLVSKSRKHPDIPDYARVIHNLDENNVTYCRRDYTDIRDRYALLFDIISKNWEKICKPRTENTGQFY